MSTNDALGFYMDQTLNKGLISELDKITKKFNLKSLAVIIMILGMDKVKLAANNMVSTVSDKIGHYVIKIFKIIKNYFSNITTKKKLQIPKIQLEHGYDLEISGTVKEMLIDYIKKNENNTCFFQEHISAHEIISKNTFKTNSKISKIKIMFNNYEIMINNTVHIKYDKINGKLCNIKPYECHPMPGNITLSYWIDMIPISDKDKIIMHDKISSYINKYEGDRENLDIIIGNTEVYNHEYDSLMMFFDHDCDSNSLLWQLESFVKSIKTNFESKTEIMFTLRNYLELTILSAVIFNKTLGKDVMKTGSIYGVSLSTLKQKIRYIGDKRADDIYSWFDSGNNKIFIDWVNSEKPEFIIKDIKCFTNSMNTSINIDIEENENKKSNAEIIQIMPAFIDYLYTNNHDTDSSTLVNVFNIEIDATEEITKKGEPEKTIEKKDSDGSIETIIIPAVPDIINKTININLEQVNSIYKDFETLYLKQDDEFKLKNILNTFDKKKDVYTELGLQFKFGCLLYGEPGTGKTSAIKSIASYLHKDIYFLDISEVKTNNELTLIFRTINEKLKDGGIIVMEDIDCMTDLVLERTEVKPTNEDLTLSHLLNILDGTLTQDDMMFIVTTNHYDKLDSAFIRPGRFDVSINLAACDRYQLSTIYTKIMKRTLPEHILDIIPVNKITPATFIYGLLPYLSSDISDEIIINNFLKENK